MELLAPAGGREALIAAVQSGADAVYLGGADFGARHGAANFTPDEMKEWTDYCHLYGVDVHVTVNTLIKEKEIPSLADYVKTLNEAGVDALIVQDLGAAELIRNTLPDMTLHASTQMTVTSLEGVKYLEKMGFSRVVLARELSAKEIERICKNTSLETEVFVHGAICMCYSGQCLMSSILGGRSGNRGRCAQPCRLPYELIEGRRTAAGGYLLSPKDMALINDLTILKNIGVTSLKIEGRLKRAEYVAQVTGVYRKYLDMAENGANTFVSREDMRTLTDAFSRGGFTDGYLKNKTGRGMMSGVSPSGTDDTKFTAEAKARCGVNANIRKIPVHIEALLKNGKPFEVTMYDDENHYGYAASTASAETAHSSPVSAQSLKDRLLKLGSTPFVCGDITVTADSGITIPVKEINAARRDAAAALAAERVRRPKGRVTEYRAGAVKRPYPDKIEITAETSNLEQLEAAVKCGVKRIYIPAGIIEGKLPDVPEGVEIVAKAADIYAEESIAAESVLVSSPAAVYKYRGKRLFGDFRLNVYNSITAELFRELEAVTLSPELNLREIEEMLEHTTANTELIVYGRLPLMIMRNCPVKAFGKCQHGRNAYTLRDRRKQEFPLICAGTEGNCKSVLLNSKPVFMADRARDIARLKINSARLIFTVENSVQCGKIIDVYRRAFSGAEIANEFGENTFTRGHFYRGVL